MSLAEASVQTGKGEKRVSAAPTSRCNSSPGRPESRGSPMLGLHNSVRAGIKVTFGAGVEKFDCTELLSKCTSVCDAEGGDHRRPNRQ